MPSNPDQVQSRRLERRVLALCLAATAVEGYDIQSAGVAAPKLAAAFGLGKGQIGWIFSIAAIGLFFGALLGGMLADRIGRRWTLVAALVLFGLGSLGTGWADDYAALLPMRLVAGLGLGAALPNVIALVAENGPLESRSARVTMVSAAIPIGGLIAALIVLVGPADLNWRTIFLIGGWAPLLIAAIAAVALPESRAFLVARADRSASRRSDALFGAHQARPTLLLWAAFFATSLVLYLMINWLPTLMAGSGFSGRTGAAFTLVFASGSAIGALALGALSWRGDRRRMLLLCYGATAAGLAMLGFAGGGHLALAVAGTFLVGCFMVGAQFILYGIAPTLYADATRGTGVGWAVAIGRLGAIAGPALGGAMLAGGFRPATAVLALLPAVAVALLAALVLMHVLATRRTGTA